MRRLHLAAGLLTVIAFLVTGWFMRHHSPPLTELSDGTRLMFRSRHIYILGSGLVNLALGVYLQRQARGWPRALQAAGSAFLLVSPVLLVTAFATEPAHGLHEETWWSHLGLYSLFAGSMLHLICGAPHKG